MLLAHAGWFKPTVFRPIKMIKYLLGFITNMAVMQMKNIYGLMASKIDWNNSQIMFHLMV